MKNTHGQNIDYFLNAYNKAEAEKIKLQIKGQYNREVWQNAALWQNIFYIAMYQNVNAAWKYYDTYNKIITTQL